MGSLNIEYRDYLYAAVGLTNSKHTKMLTCLSPMGNQILDRVLLAFMMYLYLDPSTGVPNVIFLTTHANILVLMFMNI